MQTDAIDSSKSQTGTSELPPGAGLLIGILVVSSFVMILNETIMSVALPRLMTDLSITATTAQWLTTGFMLTMAVVIPPPASCSSGSRCVRYSWHRCRSSPWERCSPRPHRGSNCS